MMTSYIKDLPSGQRRLVGVLELLAASGLVIVMGGRGSLSLWA
jgi:hypothetical protein